MRSRNSLSMTLFAIALLAFSPACKKKSKSSPSTNSGGSSTPAPQNPIIGDPGALGGTWSGKNSSGGDLQFTVTNGFIETITNTVSVSGAVAKTSTVKAKVYNEGIAIDPATAAFEGWLDGFYMTGNFSSKTSASGTIQDAINYESPELTWTTTIANSKPDQFQVAVEIAKGNMGVIKTNSGTTICEEEEYYCNPRYPQGTQLSLIASSGHPLYTFQGWDSAGSCGSFGTGPCNLNLNSHVFLDEYYSFKEINIDGNLSGTTEQGKPVSLSISNNTVTVTAKALMGTSNCEFTITETDDWPVFFESYGKTLLFYIDMGARGSVSGHFTSATEMTGLIHLNTNGIPGTATNCLEDDYFDFSAGSGIASVSSMSMRGSSGGSMEEARNRQLDMENQRKRRR